VNGEVIENSGVAEYILVIDHDEDIRKDVDFYLSDMPEISKYVEGEKIFFACKALNYFEVTDKWDGDRPLAVQVLWSMTGGKLEARLNFDTPLKCKGNHCGNLARTALRQMKEKYGSEIDFTKKHTKM
jgi:hypothetical protein